MEVSKKPDTKRWNTYGDKSWRFSVSSSATDEHTGPHSGRNSVIERIARITAETEVHHRRLLVSLEFLDHVFQRGHNIGVRRSSKGMAPWKVVEDLDADDLDVLGDAEVIGADCSGTMSSMALVVIIVSNDARDRVCHKLGALGGTAAELDMLVVDPGVNDIGDDALAVGIVVELVLVGASGRELSPAGDTTEAPGSVILRLDGHMAVELDWLNRIDLDGRQRRESGRIGGLTSLEFSSSSLVASSNEAQ